MPARAQAPAAERIQVAEGAPRKRERKRTGNLELVEHGADANSCNDRPIRREPWPATPATHGAETRAGASKVSITVREIARFRFVPDPHPRSVPCMPLDLASKMRNPEAAKPIAIRVVPRSRSRRTTPRGHHQLRAAAPTPRADPSSTAPAQRAQR